jgi:flagella basal body P-ring formation protein FlgA
VKGCYFAAALSFTKTLLVAHCLPVQGDSIRAEDVGQVIPVFNQAGKRIVGPAPLAGIERHFSNADLRRAARRLNLSDAHAAAWPAEVCFAYTVAPLTREAVIEAISQSAGPSSEFELIEFSHFPVPPGKLVFDIAGLRPDRRDGTKLHRGSVIYAPTRRVAVWARIRNVNRPKRLIAAVDLKRGTRIAAEHVEWGELQPGTTSGMTSIAELENTVTRRSIPAGTVITPVMLAPCLEIDRGEVVHVRVRAGGALLAFTSRAETGGRVGDMILLKNPASGHRFLARVESRGRVLVDLIERKD